MQELPERLLAQRTAAAKAVGSHWWQALLAAAGKWVFDYLTLVFALAAVGARPKRRAGARRLLGGIAARAAPAHPRRARLVEAGLTGTPALIGVNGGAAVLATLAYRLLTTGCTCRRASSA
jgi:uncharacterized membrane protein YbhN (UPF0104 family)